MSIQPNVMVRSRTLPRISAEAYTSEILNDIIPPPPILPIRQIDPEKYANISGKKFTKLFRIPFLTLRVELSEYFMVILLTAI